MSIHRKRTKPIDRRSIAQLEPATRSKESPAETVRRRRRPHPHEAERREQRRRRVAVAALVALVALVLVACAALAVYVGSVSSRLRPSDPAITDALSSPDGLTAPFYVLIMGSDRRPGETAARTDTLILARIDPGTPKVTLVSIPRDTRVEIPGYRTTKINAAAAHGGAELAIRTVSDFIGVPISHYVEVDFNGFKEIVDALGGVTVEIPYPIDDPKAANYDERYQRIPAGIQHLNGSQALTFVRSRDYPEGDLMRIRNQQAFIRALVTDTLATRSPLRLKSVIDAAVDNVSTDMSVIRILSLASALRGMDVESLETVTIPGTPDYLGGVSYVIPDEVALKEMIARIDQGQPAVLADEGEPVASGPDPSEITVAVRNGAGVSGLAAAAANKLTPRGFAVVETGNANQFVYDATLVVHRDAEDKAFVVRDALGIGRVVPSRGMYSFDADVLVVVGKDWGADQ